MSAILPLQSQLIIDNEVRSATGGATFHPEDRAKRWLTQGHHSFGPNQVQRIGQTAQHAAGQQRTLTAYAGNKDLDRLHLILPS